MQKLSTDKACRGCRLHAVDQGSEETEAAAPTTKFAYSALSPSSRTYAYTDAGAGGASASARAGGVSTYASAG